MPIPVVCGSCGTKLVAPDAAAGKRVKCKNCQAIIPVPEAVAEEFEFVEDAPVVVEEGEGKYESDAAPKKKVKAAIVVEADEDDAAPATKKKSKPKLVRDDDGDEADEDDAPKPKNKKGKKPAKKKSNPLVLVGIGAVVAVVAAAVVLAAFPQATAPSQPPQAVVLPPRPAAAVTIDLSADAGPVTYRASGFLHSVSASIPPDDLLTPLKPKLFRLRMAPWEGDRETGAAAVPRLVGLGARVQVIVADEYLWEKGYPDKAEGWPGDGGNFTAWEKTIADLMDRADRAGLQVEWDLWNEPDIDTYWKRDVKQFFETWKRGHRAVKARDPKAVVVGPSRGVFDRAWMEAFLRFAKANDVLPDVLSWHELETPKRLAGNVAGMREFLAANDMAVSRIDINEVVGPHHQTNPGVHVWYLAALEQAGVSGACHACWEDDLKTVNNGFNQSLDGLLTGPGGRPRAAWWVYKGYADLAGRLATVRPGPTVHGVAAADPTGRVGRAVLGKDGGGTEDVTVDLVGVASVGAAGRVRVTVERVPNAGWKGVGRPDAVADQTVAVEGGTARVTLPRFADGEAMLLTVRPAD